MHSSLRPAARSASILPIATGDVRSRARARELRLSALGIALRHFTDQVSTYRALDRTDLHVATTILTKQVESLLLAGRTIDRVAELLVDPHRVALSNWTPVADLLGAAWDDFASDVAAGAACTRAFVHTHGMGRMLSLSAWYGSSDRSPWWGTPTWSTRVNEFERSGSPPAMLVDLLRCAPETLDHLTLSRLLRSDGDRRSLVARHAIPA